MGEEGEWREEEGEGVEWRVEYAGYGRCCQGVEAVEVMTAIANLFLSPPSACRLIISMLYYIQLSYMIF